MKLLSHAGALALCACVGAGGAAAQDVDLKPTFGARELRSGFTPDPFVVKLEAGGPIKSNLGGVNAYVAKPPDFRLVYQAGNLPLTIRVESSADTTLLVNLPDGTWIADDDSGGKLNPLIRIPQPRSGRYEIWVGTVAANGNPPAQLIITELK